MRSVLCALYFALVRLLEVPAFISLKGFEKTWRVGVINRDGGQRFRLGNVNRSQTIARRIFLQREQDHRLNIVRRRLKEIADEQQIILRVAQTAGVGYEP